MPVNRQQQRQIRENLKLREKDKILSKESNPGISRFKKCEYLIP